MQDLLVVGYLLKLLQQLVSSHLAAFCGLDPDLPFQSLHLLYLLRLQRQLELQAFYLLLVIVFLVAHLIAFGFQGVDLLFLNQVQVLFHLQLPLKFSEIIVFVFIDGWGVLIGFEIRDGFLFEIY